MECPKCKFENLQIARFCGMCGTQLTVVCPSCNITIPFIHRFCIYCGASIKDIDFIPPLESTKLSQAESVMPFEIVESPHINALEGEKRIATIIMADVQSSTNLMEDIGTEAWVEVMNELFQILETEIYRYGGIVDQFRGDGLVAFFGTDAAHEDDPERAILSALSMQRMVKPYADNLRKRLGIILSIRIGINTGEVIVTSVGNKQTYIENTAMGGAIAIAARMETSADPGTILVSDNVYRLTEQYFDWSELGEIVVKGISLPIKVYRPISPSILFENRQHLELSNVLVGKTREFETIKNAINELMDGLGGIVLLVGDQGMGKSLLVSEVRRFFTRQRVLLTEAIGTDSSITQTESAQIMHNTEITFQPIELHGRSRSYNQSQAYALWNEVLLLWLGVQKEEPKEKTSNRLRDKTEEIWGDQWQEYYPYLALILSLPLPETMTQQIQRLDSETMRQQYFIAIRSWLEVIAQDTPLIIILNDMQWVDTTSLELLKYCLPLCEYLDILWILLTRPDRQSPIWDFRYFLETEYPHRLTALQLDPLSLEQSVEFIDHLIGCDCLPTGTVQMLVKQAEGNPYYIQELIRTLIANGTLVQKSAVDETGNIYSYWQLQQEVTSISVPDSLQSVLTARIDRLSLEEQQVLQMAASIGSTFWSKLLYGIGSHFNNLANCVTSLLRSQFISESGRVPYLGIEYIFKSNLIRDVAYAMLLRTQREAYHLQIAEFMKQYISEDSIDEPTSQFCSFVAHHYHEANKPQQELVYVLKNAENTSKIYANAEAAQLYSQALQIIDTILKDNLNNENARDYKKHHFDVLRKMQQIRYFLGDFSAMMVDANKLILLSQEIGEDVYIIDALIIKANTVELVYPYTAQESLVGSQNAFDLSRKINDRRREMESLISIMNLKLLLNDPSWQQNGEQALSIAQMLNDIYQETRLLSRMGSAYAFGNKPERSKEYFDKALNLAMNNALDDKVIQMTLLNLLGLEYERKGDYYRLLTEFQYERLSVSREIGHRPLESQALQACGRIKSIYLGDYASGLNDLYECRSIVSHTTNEVYILLHIAHIQLLLGQYSDAQKTLDEIMAIGEPYRDRGKASLSLVRIMMHNAIAKLEWTHSNTTAAITQFEKALDIINATRDLTHNSGSVSDQYIMAAECQAVVTHLGLADALMDPTFSQKHLILALQASEKAMTIFQQFGYAQIVECVSEEIYYRHHQALSANGEHDLAYRYLQRAYDEMITKMEMIPPDSHYRQSYLEQVPLHQEIYAAHTNYTVVPAQKS